MTWWTRTWIVGGDADWDIPGVLVAPIDEAQAVIDRLSKENEDLRLKMARLEGEKKTR